MEMVMLFIIICETPLCSCFVECRTSLFQFPVSRSNSSPLQQGTNEQIDVALYRQRALNCISSVLHVAFKFIHISPAKSKMLIRVPAW